MRPDEREIRSIELMPGGSEEKLPDYFPDLPYIATRVSLESFPGRAVPWHWHSPVEMFYKGASLNIRVSTGA